MLAEGVWAEVIVNGEHLRLFSEHNAQGVQISVYNLITKTWIAPSESVMTSRRARIVQPSTPGRTSNTLQMPICLL